MEDSLAGLAANLESLRKKAPNGEDFWMGRDLQTALGYKTWENFENVIRKGMSACEGSGVRVEYHFLDTTKEIEAGKGAKGARGDWYLTRYACYLIAMNGDSSKAEIATAQTYFAIQTRRQELADESTDENSERILLRERVRVNNKTLAGVAKDCGVHRFGIFNDAGYRGLYGMGIADLKRLKGIPNSESVLDFSGRAELAAHDFRITQTEEKLKRDGIRGETNATMTHHQVGVEVRRAIERVKGVMPERLPKEQHIKTLISAKKKAQKAAPKATPPKLLS
jgi:DNA-damage-inducible protein D